MGESPPRRHKLIHYGTHTQDSEDAHTATDITYSFNKLGCYPDNRRFEVAGGNVRADWWEKPDVHICKLSSGEAEDSHELQVRWVRPA